MPLVAEIQSELTSSFSEELSEFVVKFTAYFDGVTSNYDAVTDSYVKANLPKESRGIFLPVSDKIVGDKVQITDEQLLIISSEIDGVPFNGMKLTTSHGTKYFIISVLATPGGGAIPAIFDCIVRKI